METLLETTMNQHYKKRYDRLIQHAIDNPATVGEMHHIIPTCIGGADTPENKILLSYRAHYVAHYILAKTYGGKLWFAWTQMQRLAEGKSVLYEKSRKYVSEAVRKSNTGRVRSAETKELWSRQRKGWVVAKDAQGATERVRTDDPRYLSGELVFYRKGANHNEETKAAIGKGNKGKKMSAEAKAAISKNMKALPKKYWHSNLTTGKMIRIESATSPEGFIAGRKIGNRGKNGRYCST
tara:strand:+ start:97 stop:810 length:714 start_codon:yes stop_codon:yes gene_type:complete